MMKPYPLHRLTIWIGVALLLIWSLGPIYWTLVSSITLHHPAVLARQAMTVDHVSGGRFVLGVGAGWQTNEHDQYGIELPPVAIFNAGNGSIG